MKVLFITPYIYNEKLPEFSINHTGFGLLINEIMKYISKEEEVYVITNAITRNNEVDGVKIIQHRWRDVFLSCKVSNLLNGIVDFFKYDESILNRLKKVYYSIDNGYIEKVIKKMNPDIVHIHGATERTKVLIKICKKHNVPFVITLHGLIGLNDSVIACKQIKKVEKDFLKRAEIENIPVTVVSTGMKKRILKEYELKHGNNIYIIANGTDVNNKIDKHVDIYEKYRIPRSNKIMLCVGNITKNKNQVQVARSYALLPDKIKEHLTILIVGKLYDKTILNTIMNLNISKNVICCGSIERQLIPSYFRQASYNIVASINEGFGMSIIEGFAQGVPTITFSDLDAVPDLYNEKAMVTTDIRTDEGLSKAIEYLIREEWNQDFIKEYSKKFSYEIMAKKYQEKYKNILKDRGVSADVKM